MSVSDGKACVVAVAEVCEQLGFGVFVPEKETCGPWDLLVNGMRVQVKERRSLKEQPNRVRLRTNIGSGKVAYTTRDVDVIVIRWFSKWYVIPAEDIAARGGCIKNGIYMPSVAQWSDRWDVFDGVRVHYSQQKCFSF